MVLFIPIFCINFTVTTISTNPLLNSENGHHDTIGPIQKLYNCCKILEFADKNTQVPIDISPATTNLNTISYGRSYIFQIGTWLWMHFQHCSNLQKIEKNLQKFENLKFEIAQVDPREILNNLSLHV